MEDNEELIQDVENVLEYLLAEGVVEKTYKNGEAYYNITPEGSRLVQKTKKAPRMSLRRKKSLIMIKP